MWTTRVRVNVRANVCMYESAYVRAKVWAYVHASARSLATRARTYEKKVDLSRPYFYFRFARTEIEIRSIKVDLSRPYFRTCARARPVNVQTHARTRARPSTCTHMSVHWFAHTCTRPFTRSPYLRSSPGPLAARTPYVHRVCWSYKTIVYEAKKKLE